ncbi:MAG: hypothetical protein DMG98_22000 [Acidobacteria bacterium]|nr:MAG: hypothetical protein DMG98_22000 [Acidobacteriota bacterium]
MAYSAPTIGPLDRRHSFLRLVVDGAIARHLCGSICYERILAHRSPENLLAVREIDGQAWPTSAGIITEKTKYVSTHLNAFEYT